MGEIKVSVDLRRGDVGVAEQLLDAAQIFTRFKEMRSERVPEQVRVDAAGQTLSIQDEDNTAITGIVEFAQYGGWVLPLSGNFNMHWKKLTADKDLEIDVTGGDLDGILVYAIASV